MKKVYNVDIEDQIFPMATTDADRTVGKIKHFFRHEKKILLTGFELDTFRGFPKKILKTYMSEFFFRQLQLNLNVSKLQICPTVYCTR